MIAVLDRHSGRTRGECAYLSERSKQDKRRVETKTGENHCKHGPADKRRRMPANCLPSSTTRLPLLCVDIHLDFSGPVVILPQNNTPFLASSDPKKYKPRVSIYVDIHGKRE
jgi:hypothetical protein